MLLLALEYSHFWFEKDRICATGIKRGLWKNIDGQKCRCVLDIISLGFFYMLMMARWYCPMWLVRKSFERKSLLHLHAYECRCAMHGAGPRYEHDRCQAMQYVTSLFWCRSQMLRDRLTPSSFGTVCRPEKLKSQHQQRLKGPTSCCFVKPRGLVH